MKSILNDSALAAVSNSKKYIFRIAVGVIIAAVVMSVFLILFGDLNSINSWETNALGRVIGTMFHLGIMLVMLHITTILLESKKAVPQVFGIIGGFNARNSHDLAHSRFVLRRKHRSRSRM